MSNDDNFGPWIDWNGGKCPIPDGTPHEVRMHGGKTTYDEHPETWSWEQGKNGPRTRDIIAYRVRLPDDDLLRQAIEALRPFAEVAERDIGESETDAEIFRPMGSGNNRVPLLTVGDLRKASAVLAAYDARAAKEQS